MKRVVSELRKQGVLCTHRNSTLVCFPTERGDLGWESDIILPTLEVSGRGTLDDGPAGNMLGEASLVDLLLESIERNLSHALSREPGIVKVQPWTWLCHNDRSYDQPMDPLVSTLR